MVTVVGLQAALAEMQGVEGLLVAEGEGREEPVATEVVEEEWETAVGSAVVMEEEESVLRKAPCLPPAEHRLVLMLEIDEM